MPWKSQTTFRNYYKGKTNAEKLELIWNKIEFRKKIFFKYITLDNFLFNQTHSVLLQWFYNVCVGGYY